MARALPYTPEAYRLIHEGCIALAQVETNGIRIDEGYITKELRRSEMKVRKLRRALDRSEVVKKWRERFRTNTNFDSPKQLGVVLYEVMEFNCPGRTEGGSYKTDEATLATIEHPFIRDYLEIKKIEKGADFLKGIQREVRDGLLHPIFNLHIVVTYRSSSDSPNFQNLPNRNEQMREQVRRAIVARKGRRLVEIDYSGVEVRVACCYHKDPRMERYIRDPSTDMHRDMAMECFMLNEKQVTKAIRHLGKNQFVFPQFYGSWWMDCSEALWRMSKDLKTSPETGEKSIREHLARKGITELGNQNREDPHPKEGSFEEHIQQVEKRFWNERFKVYNQWRKDHYAKYQERGFFTSKTGFVYQGHMKRNDVINYPVQGAAFHCLLWALIEIQKEIAKRRMKALIVGQIHDSIVADVPDEEVDDFIAMCNEIMVKRLMKAWSWITVPLVVEVDVTPVGGSWVDKEERKIT